MSSSSRRPPRKLRRRTRGEGWVWGVLLAFGGALLALGALGVTPDWVALIYGVLSVLTYAAYALDKYAAKHDAWRTRERTLHLLALLCGWPGALLAQRLLRHKSAKPEFLRIYYITVFLNIASFCVLLVLGRYLD